MSRPSTGNEPIAVLLDPAKTTSGRSRFFCDLASILQGLGYRVAFGYPGDTVTRRHYPYPAGVLERTLQRRSTPRNGAERWLRWTPTKPHVIEPESLASAVHDAGLVIVPATVDAEIGEAIRLAPGFTGRIVVSDHTGARLTAGTPEGRPSDSYRSWLQLADGVHAVNEGLAAIARRHGARHTFTIPPSVDQRAFVPRWQFVLERVKRRQRTILAPGALLPAKGFATLLRAFTEVTARHPSWRLDVFGEGPERPTLDMLVGDLHLASSVTLHDFDAELAARYRHYPIVASATAFESLPLVLYEAMAAGCVSVFPATAGGPATIIRDGQNGLLARTDQEADVHEALMIAIDRFESAPGWWWRAQVRASQSAQVARPRAVAAAWRAQLRRMRTRDGAG